MKSKRTARARFVCTRCMRASPRWPGSSCPGCRAASTSTITLDDARARGLPLPFALRSSSSGKAPRQRWATGLEGLDRCLSYESSGLVPNASVIMASCPGGGKTTLWLQVAGQVSRSRRVAFVTVEQDVEALEVLAEKLGVATRSKLVPLACRSLAEIKERLSALGAAFAVVDSATALAKHDHTTVANIVEHLKDFGHEEKTALAITSHINASSLIRGGPEVSHNADTTCLLLGEPRTSRRRTLVMDKNRHGPTDNVSAEFELHADGFHDVKSPEIARRTLGIGGAWAACRDASGKPVLVEVAALTTETAPSPRKVTTSGVSMERVRLLLEILSRAGLTVTGDVAVKVYGSAPADPGPIDAACAAAIYSSVHGRELPPTVAYAGDLSLDATIRPHDITPEDAKALSVSLLTPIVRNRKMETIVEALSRGPLSAVSS